MIYIYAYIAFALATSFSSIYELFYPLLQDAIKESVDNELTRSPKIAVFVAFVINAIIAPYWFIVLIFPGAHAAALIGMSSVVKQSTKINT